MSDFKHTHKGVDILIDDQGRFYFWDKNHHIVKKPSLKSAQAAIDKEVGQVVLPAMNSRGDLIQITDQAKKRSGYRQEYVTLKGDTVGKYDALYAWDNDTADKVRDLKERESEEYRRHTEAMRALREERAELFKTIPVFDYDKAFTENRATAPVEVPA